MTLSRLARLLVPMIVLLGAGIARPAEPTLGMNELPIHDAARIGTRAEVEKLLKADPGLRDARTPMGSTPLHYAALNLDPGPLAALLAAGADVNARNELGRDPLSLARKVRADEVAGVISLWVLKGCKPRVAC